MALEYEDEVDWSDDSLALSRYPDSGSQSVDQDERTRSPRANNTTIEPDQYEQWDLPTGETLPEVSPHGSRLPRFGVPRSQRARIGVHFDRRQPTTEDYAHFALYQASQKTYEAVFLKSFISHALHPRQVQACFEDADDPDHLERYLQSVTTNVNQIVTKMIWNAHSRATNLLANDEKDFVYFWDFQRFDKQTFRNFTPHNPIPVVHKLKQSWHRISEHPPMIRYSTKDYPVGKNASSIEELDEVAETLFRHRDLDLDVATGRPVKPPQKKSKTSGVRAAALKEERLDAFRDGWLSTLPNFSNTNIKDYQNPDAIVTAQHASNADQKGHTIRRSGSDDTIHSASPEPRHDDDVDIMATERRNSLASPERLDAGLRPSSSAKEMSIPDSLSNGSGSNIHSQSTTVSASKVLPGLSSHFADRRLLRERFFPRKEIVESHPTIDVAVAKAVACGLLEPPTAEVYEQIRLAARIQRAQRKILARSQNNHTNTNSSTSTDAMASRRTNRPAHHNRKANGHDRSEPEDVGTSRKKRRKLTETTTKTSAPHISSEGTSPTHSVNHLTLDLSNPHGSKTLAHHQTLPEKAYFERKFPEEEFAWLCSCKHALGNYYLAGNRKQCPGCNSNFHNMPSARRMDFYLPPKTYQYQPAPGRIWTPSRESKKEKKSKYVSHNGIAKDAFWTASRSGATDEEASKIAVDAVEKHLRPAKRKPRTKQQQKPPTSQPEVKLKDQPRHPSGSNTLEYSQDLPPGAYWKPKEPGESYAWRCDINHAFGRYYLAGNRKACPGCGSSKSGFGKHEEMDFYLPRGVFVHQKILGSNNYKPRRPYTVKGGSVKGKGAQYTHNQMCTKRYWDAVDNGRDHDDALASAIEQTLAELGGQIKPAQTDATRLEETERTDQEMDTWKEKSETPSIANSATSIEEAQNFLKSNSSAASVSDDEGGFDDEADNSEVTEESEQQDGRDPNNHTTEVVVISSDDESLWSGDE